MENKNEFIDFLIAHGALKFGEFTLKSGRKSPYFFNLGVFCDGESLEKIGSFYADIITNSGWQYDILFGPAYKGISLVTATAIALQKKHNKNIPVCFNRKEQKDHGDGGIFIGAEPKGNLLMLDDVITAGTTVRETLQLLKNTSAKLTGIIIAFDRQERGEGELSAVQDVIKNYNVPVTSIINLNEIIEYLSKNPKYPTETAAIKKYISQYGVQG